MIKTNKIPFCDTHKFKGPNSEKLRLVNPKGMKGIILTDILTAIDCFTSVTVLARDIPSDLIQKCVLNERSYPVAYVINRDGIEVLKNLLQDDSCVSNLKILCSFLDCQVFPTRIPASFEMAEKRDVDVHIYTNGAKLYTIKEEDTILIESKSIGEVLGYGDSYSKAVENFGKDKLKWFVVKENCFTSFINLFQAKIILNVMERDKGLDLSNYRDWIDNLYLKEERTKETIKESNSKEKLFNTNHTELQYKGEFQMSTQKNQELDGETQEFINKLAQKIKQEKDSAYTRGKEDAFKAMSEYIAQKQFEKAS